MPVAVDTEVEQRLTAWAEAWSARDVAAYLAFYDPSFQPANGSPSPGRNQRELRLRGAGDIRVGVSRSWS